MTMGMGDNQLTNIDTSNTRTPGPESNKDWHHILFWRHFQVQKIQLSATNGRHQKLSTTTSTAFQMSSKMKEGQELKTLDIEALIPQKVAPASATQITGWWSLWTTKRRQVGRRPKQPQTSTDNRYHRAGRSYLAELLLEKVTQCMGSQGNSFNTTRIDHLYKDPHELDPRMKLHYGDLSDGSNLQRLSSRFNLMRSTTWEPKVMWQ